MCFPLTKCKFIVPIESNVKQSYFKYLFKIMSQGTIFFLYNLNVKVLTL